MIVVSTFLALLAIGILVHRFRRLAHQRRNPWRGQLVTPKESVARRRPSR